MATILHESHVPAEETFAGRPPAGFGQRAGALVIDTVVLSAGFLAAVALGLSLADENVVSWLLLVWVLVVAPLYFALYHAFGGPERGPGWTPGQHELGICVCDAETGGRIPPGRALARSYGGLLAAVLVVPLLADLVSLLASRERRAWHDRLSGSFVARVSTVSWVPTAWPRTVSELDDVFDDGGRPGAHALRRARALVRGHRRLIAGPTLAVYAGLVLVAAVLVPLIISDMAGSAEDAEGALLMWMGLASVLFASGVFWTQAVLVVAVEAVRVGERGLGAGGVIRRAAPRANALTVILVLLGLLALVGMLLSLLVPFVFLLLLARYALAVPVVVLEEAPSLGALRRSWQLTRGSTGRAFGLLLSSGIAIWITMALANFLGMGLVEAVIPDAGAVAFALGIAVVLMVVAVPVSLILSIAGCAWCLFYYDLRRHKLPQGEGGEY